MISYIWLISFHDFPVSVSASDFNPSPIYPLALWIKDCVNTWSPASNNPESPSPVGSDCEEDEDEDVPKMSLFCRASLTEI